jgi:acyl carrier protein
LAAASKLKVVICDISASVLRPWEIDIQAVIRMVSIIDLRYLNMTREQISEFCVASLANVLRVAKNTITTDTKFTRLGLDSAMIVYLMMELEEKLNLELSPDDFYDYPTVNDLSLYLLQRQAKQPA